MTPIKFELPGSTAVHFYAENTFFSLFLTPLLPTADQKTVHVTVPEEFAGERVHFIWDNSSEALLYRDGVPVQAFYGSGGDDRREEYLLSDSAKGGETYEFVVEMSCNGMFGNPAPGGFLNAPVDDLKFKLAAAELAVLNVPAWNLFWDFDVILGMAKELPEESARSWEAVAALEKICNVCWVEDPDTFPEALSIAAEYLKKANGESQHQITACGHCHIDTAWLWPYSETRRKCARSWSTQLTLMDEFPKYVFAASQAQQFEWMKVNYPELFEKIKAHPRFIHTGGTWVEMDCNIPSGEALVRQFLYGQKFFEKEMGSKCTEFWLPDTFGYCSQLPQIVKGSGMEFFLTQKLSWNLINKFPHSTFIWQGLDGTKVLCHFPPADTYCSSCSVKDITYTIKNHKNKLTSNNSMLLFGFGDGGGGPTRPLLERLKRMENTDQLPVVEYKPPVEFFKKIEKEASHPVWVGELYFELHNGTYTTQAACKKYNRKTEFLLTNVEFFSLLASIHDGSFDYPKEELDRLWKLVLLNQFHDVIPGTSIGAVYVDAHNFYKDVEKSGELLQKALTFLNNGEVDHATENVVVYNPLGWAREGIYELPPGITGPQKSRDIFDDREVHLGYVSAPSCGWKQTSVGKGPDGNFARIQKHGDGSIVMENPLIKATFRGGHLVSLVHLELEREAIEEGKKGNNFVLFEDIPFFWDAWDCMIYHLDKRRDLKRTSSTSALFFTNTANPSMKIIEEGPLRVSFQISIPISSASSIKQHVMLDSTSAFLVFDTVVDWHENRKFLKVEFPMNVMSEQAVYSVQFGHTPRPTHTNTSWDMAKFEVCGHHWADLNEYGFGVSLMNDSKYGYACQGNVLRLSLLRSSKQPDDKADMGAHRFKYAIYAHKGDHREANLARVGYDFNQPLLITPKMSPNAQEIQFSAFSAVQDNIVIESIKRHEADSENVVIVRVWESLGGRGKGQLKTSLPFKEVKLVNLLEEELPDQSGISWEKNTGEGVIQFQLSPFKLFTFKCVL